MFILQLAATLVCGGQKSPCLIDLAHCLYNSLNYCTSRDGKCSDRVHWVWLPKYIIVLFVWCDRYKRSFYAVHQNSCSIHLWTDFTQNTSTDLVPGTAVPTDHISCLDHFVVQKQFLQHFCGRKPI